MELQTDNFQQIIAIFKWIEKSFTSFVLFFFTLFFLSLLSLQCLWNIKHYNDNLVVPVFVSFYCVCSWQYSQHRWIKKMKCRTLLNKSTISLHLKRCYCLNKIFWLFTGPWYIVFDMTEIVQHSKLLGVKVRNVCMYKIQYKKSKVYTVLYSIYQLNMCTRFVIKFKKSN